MLEGIRQLLDAPGTGPEGSGAAVVFRPHPPNHATTLRPAQSTHSPDSYSCSSSLCATFSWVFDFPCQLHDLCNSIPDEYLESLYRLLGEELASRGSVAPSASAAAVPSPSLSAPSTAPVPASQLADADAAAPAPAATPAAATTTAAAVAEPVSEPTSSVVRSSSSESAGAAAVGDEDSTPLRKSSRKRSRAKTVRD